MMVIACVFAFILGSVLASFSGVIISRIPNHESIVEPPSHCPNCHHVIKWYDNIPILSYLILRGKCRYCKSHIPFSSLLLELLGPCSYLLAVLMIGLEYKLIFVLPALMVLLIIAFIDYEHHFIYDATQIVLGVIAIADVMTFSLLRMEVPISEFIGGGVALILFCLIKFGGRALLKKECLGGGDVILVTIAGFHLGYLELIFMMLIASIVGSVIEVTISILKKDKEREVAFAPYLCLGYAVSLIFGDRVIQALMEVF